MATLVHKKNGVCAQSGFSLVEILVGLVIGLLATLVIMQVFSVFEGQKRNTTGAGDAQTNGGIALYTISRDMMKAGYALAPVGDPGTADSALECTALTIDSGTGLAANTLAPVEIVDGGGGASDTVTIHFGDSASGGMPSKLTQGISAANPVVANVDNNLGCSAGDTALLLNGSTCTITTVNAVTTTAGPPSVMSVTLNNLVTSMPQASYLGCLGNWQTITYMVDSSGNLTRNGIATTSDIVNIQAQYGISATAGSNTITSWVNATGSWAPPVAAPARNRIKAVRLAVIARSGQMEKDSVSTACTSTSSSTPTGVCAWIGNATDPAPSVDLSNLTNWQHYRYRVFDTKIPLRPVLWSKGTF